MAVLKPGVVTVYEDDGAAKKFFVSSGSVTINDDSSVQILAEEAHPVEDIDLAAAREVVAKANADISAAADEVSNTIREQLHMIFFQAAKAEAQIALEVGEALVAAAQ